MRLMTTTTQPKPMYRVQNWSEYNDSLVNRGDITLWLSEDVLEKWYHDYGKDRPHGGQLYFSDLAIESLLTLKAVFQLTYRQTEGFARSLVRLMGLAIEVPDYSTLCYRAQTLSVSINVPDTAGPKHIVRTFA